MLGFLLAYSIGYAFVHVHNGWWVGVATAVCCTALGRVVSNFWVLVYLLHDVCHGAYGKEQNIQPKNLGRFLWDCFCFAWLAKCISGV